jgi:DNA-binding beta-propeller fold protein YncE
MSPDGKYVVVGQCGGNTLTFIDAKTHEVVKNLQVGEGMDTSWVAFTKDNKKAFVNNKSEDAVYVIDMKRMKVGKKIVTGEKDKMWKSQYHILNGPYITYEAVTPIL